MADITERAKARTYMPYLIIDEENGRFAGFLGPKKYRLECSKSEVGCYMYKDYAGKGVATKAFHLFCEYCFSTFCFRKLFLRTHESNTAAKQMAENSGFEKEGILRWDYKTTSGQLVDLIYYGRLRG